MLKINTQEELLSLLKVISSEAVAVTKMMKESADPTVSSYLKQYEKDESVFGSLSEQEDDQPESEDDQEEAPPEGAETPAEEDEESEEAAPAPAPDTDQSTDAGVSFDSVTRAINNLRSGKSLKNADVKQQASDYYDKLSGSERKALLVFLDSLSEIISGTLQGKDAQDPSDPPVSISFTSSRGEVDQKATEPEEEEAQSKEEAPPGESEEEDTTPPIKVNESQDMEALRKKVRRMMLRG